MMRACLPDMLGRAREGDVDVVVGSRHTEGGGLGDWDRRRVAISGIATWLGRLVVRARLSDPMSGFFLIRRAAFDRAVPRLSGQGFKILVDLFASSPEPLRFTELPYTFRQRQHGESKLDAQAVWSYLMLLGEKWIGRVVPIRFVLFCLVGGIGLVVHLAALWLALTVALLPFVYAQAGATVVAMTSNFLINNELTFRDRRLRGARLFVGLLSFYAVCSIGAVANVGVATMVFERDTVWWLAGAAGALIGAVWNYAASSALTWGKR